MLKPRSTSCVSSTTDEEMQFNLPQLAPSLSNAAFMDKDLWATRKLRATLYSLHRDTEGWGHGNHLILETQELTMCDGIVWPLPSSPEHSKIPEPSPKVFCSLPKWSPMLSRLRYCLVLLGSKEQSGSMVWAGPHTVSTICIQINQKGKQDSPLTQFTLFSITQHQF